MHRSVTCNVVLALTLLVVSGCYSPYIRYPNFAHPGTAAEQRADAERFDPYPDPETGPEVVGGRPPGFQRPLTETEWGRRYAIPPGSLQSAALPIVTTPPMVTNPFPPSTSPGMNPFQPSAPPVFAPAPPPPVFAPAPAPVISTPPPSSQIQPRSPY
jgi:hypothetical protein